MKLNTFHCKPVVPDTHDSIIFGPRADTQPQEKAGPRHSRRTVPGGRHSVLIALTLQSKHVFLRCLYHGITHIKTINVNNNFSFTVKYPLDISYFYAYFNF